MYEMLTLAVAVASAVATISVAVAVHHYSVRANNIAIDRAIADGWARYSEILIQPENSKSLEEFLRSDSQFTAGHHRPVHHILLIFLNNTQYEWHAMRSRLYKGNDEKSVRGLFQLFTGRRDYILSLMRANGFVGDFIAFAESALPLEQGTRKPAVENTTS